MGDYSNPSYEIVTTPSKKCDDGSKHGNKQVTIPVPAPRPSILRKKSLPTSNKIIVEPSITEVPDEDDSLGSRSPTQEHNVDDQLYDEPVKHFPPPSYPPPKPPRKSTDSHHEDDDLDVIKDRLHKKINDLSDDDDCQSTDFKGIKNLNEREINQNNLILQVPAPPGLIVNVFNHVYVNNVPSCPSRSSLESIGSGSQVPSSPPPPLPPRKASLESQNSSSPRHHYSIPEPSFPLRTPSPSAQTQDDKLLEALSRKDSIQSNSSPPKRSSPRPFNRSVTVPIEIPLPDNRSSGSVESETRTSQHSSNSIPSSDATDRSSCAPSSTLDSSFDSLSVKCAMAKHGYLYKSGPDRKTLLKRWFTLDSTALSYYRDEPVFQSGIPRPSSSPSGVIYIKDIAVISVSLSPPLLVQSNSRFQRTFSLRNSAYISNNLGSQLWYFEIGVSNQSPNKGSSKLAGRQYLLAADNEEDGRSWMKLLSLSIAPKITRPLLSFDPALQAAAFIRVQLGVTGFWTNGWLSLSDRQLHLVIDSTPGQVHKKFDIPNTFIQTKNGDEEIIPVDLRKVKSVTYSTSNVKSSSPVKPIVIQRLSETALNIETDVTAHNDLLYQLILKNWMVPTISALKDQYLTSENVPIAIDKCLNFVSTYGGLTTKGIYRLSGHMSVVRSLYDSLKSSKKIWDLHMKPEDGTTVHDVVSALKMYLRSFNECILTESVLTQLISNCGVGDVEARRQNVKDALLELPDVNYCTLKKLVKHLCSVVDNADYNEMTLSNLAPVLGPTIVYSNNEGCNNELTDSSIKIVSDIISNFTFYFDVSQEELDKEKEIIKKLEEFHTKSPCVKPAGDLKVPVYINNQAWGQCINVSLTPKMTAHDLVLYVIRTAKLDKSAEDLSLFEVVCNEQLERLVHWSEVVLTTSLGWAANWPAEDAGKNYLLVKDNRELFGKILPFLSQSPSSGGLNTTSASMMRSSAIHFTLFSELKFSGVGWGKTFKKVLFEFTGAKLNVYKDARASKVLGEWNIEGITWYMGAEKKRCPPTEYAFTFFDRNSAIERTKEGGYFAGRTVCCTTADEYYKWVAGMTITEFPQGLKPPAKPLINLLD